MRSLVISLLLGGAVLPAAAAAQPLSPAPVVGPGNAVITVTAEGKSLQAPDLSVFNAGVTTHTLSPGPTDSPRLHALVERAAAEKGITVEEQWASYAAQTSLGRLPRVEEIAWAVGMLLDPEADVLHGSVLSVDAGGHRGIH